MTRSDPQPEAIRGKFRQHQCFIGKSQRVAHITYVHTRTQSNGAGFDGCRRQDRNRIDSNRQRRDPHLRNAELLGKLNGSNNLLRRRLENCETDRFCGHQAFP